MWMCSEKSMKGLFHSHEATKSWRKRASPLPLCDLDSVITLRHPSTAPADLRARQRIQLEDFLWFFNHRLSVPHLPRVWPKQADLFLPPSGWQAC